MSAMNQYIFILASLVLFSCNNDQKAKDQPQKEVDDKIVSLNNEQLKTANLSFAFPEKKLISGTIRLSGKIDVPPQNLVSVSIPLGGYLKSTKLLPGMHVRKGEVIAVMEDQQYIQLQQDYLITKARLEAAEAEYLRQKDLNASKASSDKVFQLAKAEYRSLRVNLSGMGEKLKLINIDPLRLSEQNLSRNISVFAPFNGFVSKVNVNIGKYVNPADVLFELVNPEDIHLNLSVFEKDLPSLFVGQHVLAFTNTHPDRKYNCRIILISKNIDTDRAAEVHCHFEEYDKSLLPGMYMNAVVVLGNQEVLAVPQEAIVSFEGRNYLFLVRDKNSFEMTEVATGNAEEGYVELLNAAHLERVQFVQKGAYTLLMTLKNKAEEE